MGAVFLGGAVGTALRALLATWWDDDPGVWPWATLVVNIVGAALLGHVATRAAIRPLQSSGRQAFLGAGLCGGLTTFSTLQLEVAQIIDRDHLMLAGGYIATSVVLGLGAVVAASRWTRRTLEAR